MFRIITSFDSWHLNGVHCPSVRVGLSAHTLSEAISEYNRCNYSLDNFVNEKGNPFTEEFILEEYAKGRIYLFALDEGKEGYIVLNED